MSTSSIAAAALSSLLLVLFFLASTGSDAARVGFFFWAENEALEASQLQSVLG